MKHIFFYALTALFLFTGMTSCSSSDDNGGNSGSNQSNASNYYIQTYLIAPDFIKDVVTYKDNENLMRQGKMADHCDNRFYCYRILDNKTIEKVSIRYELTNTSWDNDTDDGNVIHSFYTKNIGGYYLYFFREGATTYSYVISGSQLIMNDGTILNMTSDGFTVEGYPTPYVKWDTSGSTSGNKDITPDAVSNQTLTMGSAKIDFITSTYATNCYDDGKSYDCEQAKYAKSGSNTATVTYYYSVDNIYTTITAQLTFSTATTGTYEYTKATNGTSQTAKGNFTLSTFTPVLAATTATYICLDEGEMKANLSGNMYSMEISGVKGILMGDYVYKRTDNTHATILLSSGSYSNYTYDLVLTYTRRNQGTYKGNCNGKSISGNFVMDGTY